MAEAEVSVSASGGPAGGVRAEVVSVSPARKTGRHVSAIEHKRDTAALPQAALMRRAFALKRGVEGGEV